MSVDSSISADNPNVAAVDLFPLVYAELRQLAAAHLAQENPGHTLQPTSLVHEAYLRLTSQENGIDFQKAWHLLSISA